MPSFTFNETSNPMMTVFMTNIEEYLFQGDAISGQIGEIEVFLTEIGKKLDPATFQSKLEDYDHFLLQALDDYLKCLNYFRVVGPFECRKLLNHQKDYMKIKTPALKRLETHESIEKETREAINTVFETLGKLRAEMNEDTKASLQNLNTYADEFTFVFELKRFIERDDMPDKMEYDFWRHFSRRLDLYDASEQVKTYLDYAEVSKESRIECIVDRLLGIEQEIFPAHMCRLDGYKDEEIEAAKQQIENDRIEREKQEKQAAKDKTDGLLDFELPDDEDDDDEADPAIPEKPFRDPDKARDIAEIGKDGEKPKPAEIIPLDRFRKPKNEP